MNNEQMTQSTLKSRQSASPKSHLPTFPSVRFLPNQQSEEEKKKIVERLKKSGFKLPQGPLNNQKLQQFLRSVHDDNVPHLTENDAQETACQQDLKKLNFLVLAAQKFQQNIQQAQSQGSVSFATDRSIIYSLLGKDEARQVQSKDFIQYIEQPNRLTLTIPEHEDQQNSMVSTPMSVGKPKPIEEVKTTNFEATRRKYKKLAQGISQQPIHRGKTYGRSYLDVYYADCRSQVPTIEKQRYQTLSMNSNPYVQSAQFIIQKSREALRNSNF